MHISKYFTKNHEDLHVWSGYKVALDAYSQFLTTLLGPEKNELVLDDGCGNGRFANAIISEGAKVVGLDISKPILKTAAKLIKQKKLEDCAEFVQGDVQNLPFKDGVFDKLLCAHNLWYVPNYEAAISEMLRTLGDKGKLVVDHLNLLNWRIFFGHCFYILRCMARRNPTPVFERTPKQILKPFTAFNPEVFSLAPSRKFTVKGTKTLAPRLIVVVSKHDDMKGAQTIAA